MASNIYRQSFADGTSGLMKRSVKQGRKPGGLGKPKLIRLSKRSEETMALAKERLGRFYNENEFVRTAVDYYVDNVYTELLNS